MTKSALLVLENGAQFYGQAIGADGTAVGEVVFNTSITGYQEILTDPSYFKQIITFTYPNIGNTGINDIDNESSNVQAKALIIRNLSPISSNFRSTLSLSDYLKQKNIIGISDIDTRKLTRILRKNGLQNGCIISGNNLSYKIALNLARSFTGMNGIDLVKEISTIKQYTWIQGSQYINKTFILNKKKLIYHIVIYDYGIKRNIMRMLVDRGCRLTIVPADTSAETVLNMNPDGIFLSNGPGDPAPCHYAILAIKKFLTTKIPLFGICLGYQLLALANGAKTIKMKFGHHGGNHPVKNVLTNKIMITTQNHCFTVDRETLPSTLKITHISLFDNTLQGLHCIGKPAFGFQGHPEASPGPHDMSSLFDYFIKLINAYRFKHKKLGA